jgi:hypothetical protein
MIAFKRNPIMMKNCMFALALLSLALAGGCAKGGAGFIPTVKISPPPNFDPRATYPTQSVTYTVATTNPANAAVTWSLVGAGTLTPNGASATYVAPASPATNVTLTATLVSDPAVKYDVAIDVVDITTQVAPLTPSVGTNLIQQFAAVAVPDDAPQTLTWTCTANGAPCANFVQDPNVSGLAYYTAQDNCAGNCVQISAASPLDPAGCTPQPAFCTTGTAKLVSSRVSGTYAFRFSGYDNANNATAMVGTFTVASNGTISGIEEDLASSGQTHQITGGSYTPIASSDPNSNNAGTLTLKTAAVTNSFQVVLDGAGDIEMVESDSHGTGSGVAQISAASSLFKSGQTYAFGFTGVDSGGNRVGYVGVLTMSGGMSGGTISSGQMDTNDNANPTNICGTGPCTIATTSSYAPDATINGLWHMVLDSGTAVMKFDFFIASGSASSSTPLTFYAISTDQPGTNPAVSGTMVLQDSTQTYNTAAFNATSVSALTGVNGSHANVSLTQGTTDGNGHFAGAFDQNNAGQILTVQSSISGPGFSYTYAASGASGRYTFQMLGNPGAMPVVSPLPFVLYASGANRGFLLDQSSPSVMTGTMNPQGRGSFSFSNPELSGTYAAATTSSGGSAVSPFAANLLTTLLTPQGSAETFNVSGRAYPGGMVTGAFDLGVIGRENGTGTITLTAPSAQNYAIYVLDTAGCNFQGKNPVCLIQDFLMIDEDTPNPNQDPSIIFAKQ